MKKWIKRLALIVLAVIVLMIAFLKESNELIEITTITKKEFIQYYKIDGVVDSEREYQYYQGTIKSIDIHEKQQVHKDEIILNYIDNEGKSKQLKSQYDGLIEMIDSFCVTIKNKEYYISVYLPYDKYCVLTVGEECSYCIKEEYYPCTIINKSEVANEQSLFEVQLSFKENNLMLNQKVVVSLPIRKENGLAVDKEAVIDIEGQHYLLKESFSKKLQNYRDYLVEIEILMENSTQYLIDGIGLENMNVCVLTDVQKEVLLND